MTGYRTVVWDPPWLEQGGGKSVRGAQRHYALEKPGAAYDLIRERSQGPRLDVFGRRPIGGFDLWNPTIVPIPSVSAEK